MNWPEALHKGWRLIRIPLRDDRLVEELDAPAWNEIRQIRLWVTGLDGQRLIQIGAIRITGLD